jgi:hypothetical protein
VLRAYAKNAVMRMYEKFSTFLRLEALSNNLRDFGLTKGLDHLDKVRTILGAVTDRFAAFEARALDVHVDFPLFQRLALPIPRGAAKIPGIKIHDSRMLRLMEVLLHGGTKVLGWRASDIHQSILASFTLSAERYTLTQLRYDLRKLKAHRLLERDGRRYAYRLTDKGTRSALLFVLFHRRVCGPPGQQPVSPPPHPNRYATVQNRSRLSQGRPLHRPSHPTPRGLMLCRSENKILRLQCQVSRGAQRGNTPSGLPASP